MAITVTDQEKAELQAAGSLIRPLAGADGAPSTAFHNPKTGQEFINLPIDPYHLGRHLQRGLVMGPPSPELRAKWEAGEAERQAANDTLMAEHLSKAPPPIEESPRFNEAVAAAVTQVLEKIGIDLPTEAEKVAPVSVLEGPQKPEPEYDVQLPLSVSTDAPSESETKHVVSQASRPDLHLVE